MGNSKETLPTCECDLNRGAIRYTLCNMAKEIVALRLEREMIDRIDAVAQKMGETRTEVLDRMIESKIEEFEESVESFKNPLVREVVGEVLKSPALVTVLATLVGKKVTPEKTKAFTERISRLQVNSRKPKSESKSKPKEA